ncbi:MAG: TetR/AcrR family transcriptional regulator [Candidatus Sulfotelmatobacter sp.]
MPRPPNPDLEERILKAARKLWKKGGENALTMRAVAKAAGTNTPAVYRRFRDREDILRGLLQRIRSEFGALMEGAGSAEDACERYLDYALNHPHEYELFYQHEYELFYSGRAMRAGARNLMGRPARIAMKKKLAERFGGAPEDHSRLTISLWMLAHGAAMLMIAKTILPEDADQARAIFTASVAALLKKSNL